MAQALRFVTIICVLLRNANAGIVPRQVMPFGKITTSPITLSTNKLLNCRGGSSQDVNDNDSEDPPLQGVTTTAMKRYMVDNLQYTTKDVSQLTPRASAAIIMNDISRPESDDLPSSWCLEDSGIASSAGVSKRFDLKHFTIPLVVVLIASVCFKGVFGGLLVSRLLGEEGEMDDDNDLPLISLGDSSASDADDNEDDNEAPVSE